MEALTAEKEEAEERAQNAERKLENASDESMIRIKLIVDDLQDMLRKANTALKEIEPEKAEKLRNALKKIVEEELR